MKTNIYLSFLLLSLLSFVSSIEVLSPDKRVSVNINVEDGLAKYSVKYDNKEMILPSRLGLKSNIGDFSQDLTLTSHEFSHEIKVIKCLEQKPLIQNIMQQD